ncbi:hypothetical protein B0H17DRAFT_1213387 [Mycena rosella]|uniref:Uncharacterized protein n=1 Tax=Mycena rosella TaxID=1033263 RepID=A0AAD7CQD7_MYCRO|nr:hypothetical protein B0H17DRAFT_1213387 [Mycena rosella]
MSTIAHWTPSLVPAVFCAPTTSFRAPPLASSPESSPVRPSLCRLVPVPPRQLPPQHRHARPRHPHTPRGLAALTLETLATIAVFASAFGSSRISARQRLWRLSFRLSQALGELRNLEDYVAPSSSAPSAEHTLTLKHFPSFHSLLCPLLKYFEVLGAFAASSGKPWEVFSIMCSLSDYISHLTELHQP